MKASAVLNFSLSLVCLLLITTTTTQAEVPQVGRLQNGKPYRIDPQGIKITDQLAELEVENNDLRRQLIALEDQLKGKPQLAAVAPSCPSCPSCVPTVKSDALDKARMAASCPPVSCPTANCPSTACPPATCPAVSCPQVSCPATDCTASIKPFQEEAQASKRRTEELEEQVASLQNSTNGQLAGKNTELATLSADLTQARKRMAELESELNKELSKQQAQSEQARANLKEPVLREDEHEDLVVTESSSEDSRSVVEVQNAIRSHLSKVQSLIIERKNLLDRVKSSRKGVSIQIQSLVSSRGRSLDTLRVAVTQSTEANDLIAAERELGEIRAKLQTDIGVLNRLSKLP